MTEKASKSKNDIAWETLFAKYDILNYIKQNGLFEITSTQINEERESRLMAKFDHKANLPLIFKKNNLSILPLSRSKYIIGNFQTHLTVKYNAKALTTTVSFPEDIESIDYTHLNSENIAINCAFNSGIIKDLVESCINVQTKLDSVPKNFSSNNYEVYYSISGRMSTGTFSFSINNIDTNINEDISSKYWINVNNSQCEIDAGFESRDYFLIIEAKNYEVDDFLVRQLYYPYRLWSSKISKKVIPVLMTYSNSTGVFSFFIYKFKDINDYNSVELVFQCNYKISPEYITREEIDQLYSSIKIKPKNEDITFPQADDFKKIVDLISLLKDQNLTRDEITLNYQFDARQTNYYTDAARYLNLVEKCIDNPTQKVFFQLTTEGNYIVELGYKRKILKLTEKILENEVFYKTYQLTLENGTIPSKKEICQIMTLCNLNFSPSTIERRSSTVRRWIEWILQVVE
jgi:hypothetical protein